MKTRCSNRSTAPRHVPQRTCLACREVKAKRELVRLVRAADGSIEIDATGKKAGRGVYLCRVEGCWEAGLNRNRLEHALRNGVTLENREQLLGQARELLRGAVSGSDR